MILGFPYLTMDMVKAAYWALPAEVAAELKDAEELGVDSFNEACEKHRSQLTKVLGLTTETGGAAGAYPWEEELQSAIRGYAEKNNPNLLASDRQQIFDDFKHGVCRNDAILEYIIEEYKAAQKLSQLNGTLGACTPKLCKLLMDAPNYLPLSLYLSRANSIQIGDVPDVPLSFMDNFPEMLDDEDYNTAFMKAYIISCLELFFDRDAIDNVIRLFPDDKLRLHFPQIVWMISGHMFYDAEYAMLANLTNW